jgi:glucose/arabinose dehydrogenase
MGPMGGDELNLIERGVNYGWPLVSQGNHYDGRQIPKHNTRPEFAPPKAFWVPVISPGGLIIYKGDLFASWKGNAIISGLSSQSIVRVTIAADDTAKEAQRISMGKRMRGIREDKDGAIWVIEDGPSGRLLKLTPN